MTTTELSSIYESIANDCLTEKKIETKYELSFIFVELEKAFSSIVKEYHNIEPSFTLIEADPLYPEFVISVNLDPSKILWKTHAYLQVAKKLVNDRFPNAIYLIHYDNDSKLFTVYFC